MGKNMPDSSAITVDAITVQYGRRTVLDGVSVSVAPGEIRVILGTSGCGKTTLLKAMIGLLQPVRGRVTIFGNRITEIDAPITVDTLKHVGVLFQNGALLGSLTVGENVALPLQMHTHLSKNMVRELVQLCANGRRLPERLFLIRQ
jgi:phospholipid/cholesterol/gamma-HCH transport system ATP-binding protein